MSSLPNQKTREGERGGRGEPLCSLRCAIVPDYLFVVLRNIFGRVPAEGEVEFGPPREPQLRREKEIITCYRHVIGGPTQGLPARNASPHQPPRQGEDPLQERDTGREIKNASHTNGTNRSKPCEQRQWGDQHRQYVSPKRKITAEEGLTIDAIREVIKGELRVERHELKSELKTEFMTEVKAEIKGAIDRVEQVEQCVSSQLANTLRLLQELTDKHLAHTTALQNIETAQKQQATLDTLTNDNLAINSRVLFLEGKLGQWQGRRSDGRGTSSSADPSEGGRRTHPWWLEGGHTLQRRRSNMPSKPWQHCSSRST